MNRVGELGFIWNTGTMRVKVLSFLNTEEYIYRFKKQYFGKDVDLSPPKNSNKSILKVSLHNFKIFKKYLGIDNENESAN